MGFERRNGGDLRGCFLNFWEMRSRRLRCWGCAESLQAGLGVKWWTERLSTDGLSRSGAEESGISVSANGRTRSSGVEAGTVAFASEGAIEDAWGGASTCSSHEG